LIIPKSDGGKTFDPSLKQVLKNIGFKNVIELDELESIAVGGGEITGLPFLGEHADLGIRTKIAYLINLSGKTVLCAADSNNIEPRLYEHLSEITGSIDILFLGMECDGAPLAWVYGPFMMRPLGRKMDQSRRLNGSNYERAIEIIDRLRPKEVYVYAMGQEPWLTFVTAIKYTEESYPITESNRLIEACKSRGIHSEMLLGHKEIF
jgi:L-ascorbate metabolism protein UlaG (beta-lactamase superfamily)